MSEKFDFNAPQFVDFCNGMKEEDIKNTEAYFEQDHEQNFYDVPIVEKIGDEGGIKERISDGEKDMEEEYFSAKPSPCQASVASMSLRSHKRKSMSTGNLLLALNNEENYNENELNKDMKNLDIVEDQIPDKTEKSVHNTSERRSRTETYRTSKIRSSSASRPKLSNRTYHSVAETAANFQKGFRSMQDTKPFHFHTTIPQSPTLKTKQRARPTVGLSKEDQETKKLEDAKKYKIKAKPVNTKISQGPLKVPVDKKPPTIMQPFKTTDSKQMVVPQKPEIPLRKDMSVSLESQKPPQKRLQKQRSLDHVDSCSSSILNSAESTKLTRTNPVPFSFDERDKQLKKKKEEFINKLLEEERKAREFHARPPPKYLQQTTQQKNNTVPVRRTASSGEMRKSNMSMSKFSSASPPVFKARPPTVLYVKPFEPKLHDKPLIEITEFHLNTDKRAQERKAFEEDLKKKQERVEKQLKEAEEQQKAREQEQISLLRKQAEHKANPIRHYKEIVIKKSNKITVPVSPKFAVEARLQNNKENVNH